MKSVLGISVLGIDAAWSDKHPSGVALIRQDAGGDWRFVAVAPSYASFIQKARGRPTNWDETPAGGLPLSECLLASAHRLLGEPVTVVSVDMPLSRTSVTKLRKADADINDEFRSKWCGVYTPTDTNPGPVSTRLQKSLDRLGYPLAVNKSEVTDRATIEVYPHTALLRLLNLDCRLPYKVAKSNSKGYWRGKPVKERVENLLTKFGEIREGLVGEIEEIPKDFLPSSKRVAHLTHLKRYEDALDALVCAWVGARYLAGCATAYGDHTAAIWVPNDRANE